MAPVRQEVDSQTAGRNRRDDAVGPAGGLSPSEAARRLAVYGPNVLAPEARRTRLRRLVGPLMDPMVALLLVAAPTYLVIGDKTDALVTIAAVLPVAGVGWLLEARAEHTLARLRELTAPTTTVWRGGVEVAVPATELVPGDLVALTEGDVVPADAEVMSATQLGVDESTLTGESTSVAKMPSDLGESQVWAGSVVVSGRGVVTLTATGPQTRYGQIGALVANAQPRPTPLQSAIRRLVRTLVVVAAVFCVAVMGAELARGAGWGDAIIAGVSLAIAAIPEEFAMVYALYLALGAWRLARDHALVRRLPAVESLGSTTIICTDKTGTMTRGRQAVVRLVPVVASVDAELELLEAAVLACEPAPFDPIDKAILVAARARGVDVDSLQNAELVADWPFDPIRRHLTHVWAAGNDVTRVAAKGAWEGISALVSMPPGTRDQLEQEVDELSAAGMRVLAVAEGTATTAMNGRGDHESSLRIRGLIGFEDPLRDGVRDSVFACQGAGIRVLMVTGDHPATAVAVARQAGVRPQRGGDLVVVTGNDLDHAPPADLAALVARADVIARARPEQKHAIVVALKEGGEVVAMTGDGVNDAPALKESDIGVAMGQRGTAVAREAADLVLLDDDFSTIVRSVADGRRIYDNLGRAFSYLVAFHPPLLLAALVIPLIGRPLLLLPVHLVLLELILHPAVSLVFEADPPAATTMTRPPRTSDDGMTGRRLVRPFGLGLTLAGAVIGVYVVALARGWPVTQGRALAFETLLLGQLVLLFVERAPRSLLRAGPPATPALAFVSLGMGAAMFGAVYFHPLAALLKLSPFPPASWLLVTLAAAGATLWSEPLKRRFGGAGPS